MDNRRAARGLSLLELAVALVVLGLLVSLTPPALNSIGARWRLRGAAQEIEGVVRWAQNAAAARGVPESVLYDLPERSYWVRLRGKVPVVHTLPRGVRFDYVDLGDVRVVNDVAVVRAFPNDTLDSHEVLLLGEGDLRLRIAFDRLTGEPFYEEGQHAPR